jgi:hypothetical protein
MVGVKLFQMRVLSAGAARGTTAHGSTVAFADDETSQTPFRPGGSGKRPAAWNLESRGYLATFDSSRCV